jgi:hypothetical protein
MMARAEPPSAPKACGGVGAIVQEAGLSQTLDLGLDQPLARPQHVVIATRLAAEPAA